MKNEKNNEGKIIREKKKIIFNSKNRKNFNSKKEKILIRKKKIYKIK